MDRLIARFADALAAGEHAGGNAGFDAAVVSGTGQGDVIDIGLAVAGPIT
jgi:hypothetical protein